MSLFVIAVVALWVYPFLTFWLIKKLKVSKNSFLSLTITSIIIVFFTLIKFSTISYFVDWLLFSVVIFTAWLWIWRGWNEGRRAYQILSKLIGIPLVMFNLFVGTVGVLGILMVISDIKPSSIKKLNNGLIYKEYLNGMLDSSNKMVKLYQPVLYLFEWEKDHKKYFWPDPGYYSKLSLEESADDKLILTVIENDSVIWRDEMKY